jgi:flagellin
VVFASARDYTVRSAASGGLFNNVNANASALNNVAAVDITTQAGANAAIGVLDGALSFVQDERAMLGATQNRLSTTVSNLTNVSSNTEASRSAIWDTDFAKTSSILAKQKILQQAGTAMLVQANQNMQGVLSLLR